MWKTTFSCAFVVSLFVVTLLSRARAREAGRASDPSPQLALAEPQSMPEVAKVSVVDVKISMVGGTPRFSQHSNGSLSDLKRPRGNALKVGSACDGERKLLITLRMLELVRALHLSGEIHGNLFPGVFDIEEDFLALYDIGLYATAQEMLEAIPIGPSHPYKSLVELKQDVVVPSEAMDVHSAVKSIIAIYNGFPPTLTFFGIAPRLSKPQEMPEELWNVLEQCLAEDLVGVPSIHDVVAAVQDVIQLRRSRGNMGVFYRETIRRCAD